LKHRRKESSTTAAAASFSVALMSSTSALQAEVGNVARVKRTGGTGTARGMLHAHASKVGFASAEHSHKVVGPFLVVLLVGLHDEVLYPLRELALTLAIGLLPEVH
jgi:hypothetical protein